MFSKQLSIHTFFCDGSQSRRKCIHRRTHITQYTESRALSTSARPLRTIGALSYEYCRNERVRVSQVHREKRGGFEINSLPQRTGPSRSAVVPWIRSCGWVRRMAIRYGIRIQVFAVTVHSIPVQPKGRGSNYCFMKRLKHKNRTPVM